MSGTHVMSELRSKRAEVAELVHDTEKKLAHLRASLANLDAAMNILTPDHPDHIAPRRRKTRYFAANELPRLTMDALRKATGPLSAGEIAAHAIAAKGLPDAAQEAVRDHVLTILRAMSVRGAVTRTGSTRSARWAVASGG
jgi:hypothetical protein